MIISHNLPALNANNKLAANVTGLSKASQKLSSGFRINKAADDAAGLAVSEKLRSQIRGLTQSIRNAQDGISYIQTAEGALDSIHGILQRCKELASESANGNYDDDVDRAAIQLEFDELRNEVDHEAMTDFNGKYVFDTTGATPPDAFGNAARMAEGDYSETRVKITLSNGTVVPIVITCDSLALGQANGKSPLPIGDLATKLGVSTGEVERFANEIKDNYLPKLLGGIVSALPKSSIPTTSGMTIGFNFYDENSSVLANVTSDGTRFQLNINAHHLEAQNGSIVMDNDLVGTVAHEMTHAVMFDTLTNGMLGIGPDGKQDLNNPNYKFPHWFTEGMAETVGGGISRLYDIMGENNVNVGSIGNKQGVNVSISDIQTWMSDLKGYTDTLVGYSRGYAACMYLGYLVGGGKNLATGVNSRIISKGLDTILTAVASGYSLDATIAHYTKYTGIDDFVDKIGEKEPAEFVNALIKNSKVELVNDNGFVGFEGGAGSIISPSGLSGDESTFLNHGNNNFFKLDLGKDWSDESIFDGMPANKKYEGGNTKGDPNKDRDGNTPTHFPAGATGIDMSYEKLMLQVGARSKDSVEFTFEYVSSGIGDLESDLCCTSEGLGLNMLTLADQENANAAIDSIDNAINKVSLIRASFGAVGNRLEHKLSNLTNVNENLTKSESQIRDTDMASEMINYTKFQILQSAAQTMLVQANQFPQSVLSLLSQ